MGAVGGIVIIYRIPVVAEERRVAVGLSLVLIRVGQR